MIFFANNCFYFLSLQYSCVEHLNIYFSKTNIIFRDTFGVFFQVQMIWYKFLLDVCICGCMLHNIFKCENGISIVQLLHIIELKVNTHYEGQQKTTNDEMNQM